MESVGVRDMNNLAFFKGKKVFLTGHTGFKGSWLSRILILSGAEVTGYALEAPVEAKLFDTLHLEKNMHSVIGDIRDREKLIRTMQETNVMGTVNILEAVRQTKSVKSFLNVTTDKVYKNNEWEWGYREIDELDGYDPYSNSKSCSELVTHSYEKSFLKEAGVAVSTARAGNVIGGGDFAPDRIIPDCVRAVAKGEKIAVRNPHSTRPYQHVLEPLGAYLMIAQAQYENPASAGSYNVGPGDEDCITTGQLADLFCNSWGGEAAWENLDQGGPHEANFLKLDCSKIRTAFGWKPHWQVAQAVKETAVWYQVWLEGKDMEAFTDEQIRKYFTLQERK